MLKYFTQTTALNTTQMKHYYQTTPLESNETLLEAQGRAISQEDRILEAMKGDGEEWTAWQLKNWFPDFEITSVRRALFNLEKQGKISRSGWVPGPKGKPVGKFRVNNGLLF